MIKSDESCVLIDFERSVLNADRMMLIEEEDEVRLLLESKRKASARVPR